MVSLVFLEATALPATPSAPSRPYWLRQPLGWGIFRLARERFFDAASRGGSDALVDTKRFAEEGHAVYSVAVV
jgi:hypothetical protein